MAKRQKCGDKQLRKLFKAAEDLGCTILRRPNGHWRINTPSGATVFCSASPSDKQRAYLNIRSDLRHAGVAV